MKIDKKLIEDLLKQAAECSRLRMSYDLRTTPEEKSQRVLNALMPGTIVPIHRHRQTDETVMLLRGQFDEVIYDDNKNETDRITLNANEGCYGVQIPKGIWHTVEVNEPSVIIEVKDGAYQPLSAEDILE